MEDKYLKLLTRDSYDVLSSDEKNALKELCSNQEEFENAKHFMYEMAELDSGREAFDSEKIKSKLDETFSQVYSGAEGGGWFHFLFPPLTPLIRRPGVQLAAVFILALGSYVFLQFISFDANIQRPTLAENTQKNERQSEIKELSPDDESILTKPSESKIMVEDNVEIVLQEEDVNRSVRSSQLENASPLPLSRMDSESAGFALSFNAEVEESIVIEDEVAFELDTEIVEDHQKFLIPTIEESPELLDGLFVTF